MERLNSKAIWLFFFQSLKSFAVLVGVAFIFSSELLIVSIFMSDFWTPVGLVLLVMAIPLAIILPSYIRARLSYRFWRYDLADQAFKIERGVIRKRYISIPYDRIQNVDIYRGLLARMLGLSDLQIQTAGYSGAVRTEGRLPGLDPRVAESLRETLVSKTKITHQGL